jgi:hypothetical protein
VALVSAGLAESSVKLERNKDKMYTLRITRKDEKVLRSKQGTFTVVETRKDGVKFTYAYSVIHDTQTRSSSWLRVAWFMFGGVCQLCCGFDVHKSVFR